MVRTTHLLVFAITLLAFVTLCGCKKREAKPKDFDLLGEFVDQGKLRLDGYYLNVSHFEEYNEIAYVVFYSNGLLLQPRGSQSFNMPIGTELESSGYFDESFREDHYNWGVFDISNSTITIEFPNKRRTYRLAIPVDKLHGEVTSDTSFILSSITEGKKTTTYEKPSVYRFFPLDSKPDSTSVLYEDIGYP